MCEVLSTLKLDIMPIYTIFLVSKVMHYAFDPFSILIFECHGLCLKFCAFIEVLCVHWYLNRFVAYINYIGCESSVMKQTHF